MADALNLNAGVALAAAKVASSPKEGVAMAQEAQRAGKAAGVLKAWVDVSHSEARRSKQPAHDLQPSSFGGVERQAQTVQLLAQAAQRTADLPARCPRAPPCHLSPLFLCFCTHLRACRALHSLARRTHVHNCKADAANCRQERPTSCPNQEPAERGQRDPRDRHRRHRRHRRHQPQTSAHQDAHTPRPVRCS